MSESSHAQRVSQDEENTEPSSPDQSPVSTEEAGEAESDVSSPSVREQKHSTDKTHKTHKTRNARATGRPVYIVDGARTPFLRARGRPGPFTPVELAVQCGRALLARQPFHPHTFDKVILGCVNVLANELNPARVAAMRLGMGAAMPAYTVQINCGSGMQSIENGFRSIQTGKTHLVLAGGAEAQSHVPPGRPRDGVVWRGRSGTARSWFQNLVGGGGLGGRIANPAVGLEPGSFDPITRLNMGQTAELIGHLFDVSREAADLYALDSHQRLSKAQKTGLFSGEVVPILTRDGTLYEHDDGVLPDVSLEQLARLQPVYERPYGRVTAGNASQVTDGASWVILASEAAVRKHKLTPLARIVDSQWSALDPSLMGLAPTLCTSELLQRNGMTRSDIHLWELNEAFAAQVLACLAAWEDTSYCRYVLGLDRAFGRIERNRLNVDGGAISLGHPVGTSGNRIVLHLVNAMRKRGQRKGIATECIAGGLGGAMLLEMVQ